MTGGPKSEKVMIRMRISPSQLIWTSSRTIVLKRPVFDPMGQGEQAHREALEQVEKVVGFLGQHFRRARDWNPVEVSAEDVPRTTSGPPPLPRPLQAAAKAASI